MQNLLERICVSIEGKKIFLVLDDVWTDNIQNWQRIFQTLKRASIDSLVLLTTRKNSVADMLKDFHAVPNIREESFVFRLAKLSEEDCWMVFSSLALSGRSDHECKLFEETGRSIANKCKGLPLAAKTLGSLLRDKNTREEWQKILDSEIWQLQLAQKEIFAPLLLSYYDLPSPIRRCFMYCAVFPKDFDIRVHHMIEHWIAQGFLGSDGDQNLELTGKEYFHFLANRSFFQDFKSDKDGRPYACKLHDIVHDFAQFLTSNEIVIKEVRSRDNSLLIDFRSSTKVRHLTVMLPERTRLASFIQGVEKLRSFVTFSGEHALTADALRFLFYEAKNLRVLDLNWPDIYSHIDESIPKEIGRLIHLRYINLSLSKNVKSLPESLSELRNLQTLDLKGCEGLEELPDSIENLSSLRTLVTDGCTGLTFYPKGVGRLTSLQSVQGIIARMNRNDPKEFCFGDLENLNNLRVVVINCQGAPISNGEIRRANLPNKKYLHKFEVTSIDWKLERRDLIQALHLPTHLHQ